MSGLGDTIGEGGDPGSTAGRFDPGQGANEAGNAPLNPDPRHTPGCGFDPATGAVATAFAPADASVQYDPVTQTVAVEELSEFNKDSIPLNLPAGYTAGEQPHAAPDLGEEEGKKKE